jgi:two-component sensor histidine kinase
MESIAKSPKGGLGTSLVAALAQQLGAEVEAVSSMEGQVISIRHKARAVQRPLAA